MPRLVYGPTGVTVEVSEEKAQSLGSAWRPVEEPKKQPAKRQSSK